MRSSFMHFYDPKFSFRELTDKYPDARAPVTDCLSAIEQRLFSLWQQIEEFVPLPEILDLGEPCGVATEKFASENR